MGDGMKFEIKDVFTWALIGFLTGHPVVGVVFLMLIAAITTSKDWKALKEREG